MSNSILVKGTEDGDSEIGTGETEDSRPANRPSIGMRYADMRHHLREAALIRA